MSFPLAFPPKHRRFASARHGAFAKGRPSFHRVTLDTLADALPLTLSDAGLQPEDWEAVEIDERAAIPVVVAPAADWLAGRRVVRPYRDMIAAYRARHGLA